MIKCPKCGSENVQFIANTQSKNRGLGSWILWIVIAFCTFGIGLIFLFFMALTNKKTTTKTRAICKNCGNQWDI
jgi:predicted permease